MVNRCSSPVIVGCGYVGKAVEALHRAAGETCRALTLSEDSAKALRASGIDAVARDIGALAPEQAAEFGGRSLYLFVPPEPQGRSDARLRRFLAACASKPPARIVSIGASGVYGDCNGAWVDETRPVAPRADRAWRRWDGEQALREWSRDTGAKVVFLRVAGIYGPGRLPLRRIRSGAPIVSRDQAPFTNRIHVEDLARLCVVAMERGAAGRVYHACDGSPGNMTDYFHAVADFAALPRLPEIPLAEAEGRLSAGLLSYLRESRRLRNRRAREELGLRFRYPNLAAGLAACRDAGDQPFSQSRIGSHCTTSL